MTQMKKLWSKTAEIYKKLEGKEGKNIVKAICKENVQNDV